MTKAIRQVFMLQNWH